MFSGDIVDIRYVELFKLFVVGGVDDIAEIKIRNDFHWIAEISTSKIEKIVGAAACFKPFSWLFAIDVSVKKGEILWCWSNKSFCVAV